MNSNNSSKVKQHSLASQIRQQSLIYTEDLTESKCYGDQSLDVPPAAASLDDTIRVRICVTSGSRTAICGEPLANPMLLAIQHRNKTLDRESQ